MSKKEVKTCDLCGRTSNCGEDTLVFGEWMMRPNITVHYFCLLLSSNLQQNGGDSSGILGFLLRDIRREIAEASRRKCTYCREMGASLVCQKCGVIFHLSCGLVNACVMEFCHQFHSYCDGCAPMDDYKRQLLANPPKHKICDICLKDIAFFKLNNVAYGDCCRQGFVHKQCMRQYALNSGYYLRCIWCREKSFRDLIRLQSIYVPDREATWEKQQNAYQDLHQRNIRCEESECLCPNGRNFNGNTWLILPCKLCASMGAHAKCVAGITRTKKKAETLIFKCSVCLEVEQKLSQVARPEPIPDPVNPCSMAPSNGPTHTPYPFEGPVFSDEDEATSSEHSSVITVIPSQHRYSTSISPPSGQPSSRGSPTEESVVEITDSQPLPLDASQGLVLRQSFSCPDEPFFYLVVYEFDDRGQCLGSCTLRFAEDDPRIEDRSAGALERLETRPEDVWYRDKDCGVYAKIDLYQAR
ncbi:hypothetical protein KR009_005792 [Drosophila setifemur]|nr:hypothetical protein KR009_005792 [Drosophila setifemur]